MFNTGLLQKNPAKRLNWPHLANHPFVVDTEADRKRRNSQPFQDSRRRLALIMSSESNKLFETLPVGKGSSSNKVTNESPEELPYAKIKRERQEIAMKKFEARR